MTEVMVYTCFGLGDNLMASGLVKQLLLMSYRVHLVCEEIGVEIYDEETKSQFASITPYRRNPDLSVNKEKLLYETASLKYDILILPVPSNNGEGLFLKRQSNFITFGDAEWALRQYHHTMDLNTELLNKLSGIRRLSGISYGNTKFTRNILDTDKNILMHVGAQHSGWRHKAFPLKLFKETADKFIAAGYSVYVIGDDKQTVYAKSLPGVIDFTRKSLSETINLIKRSVCYIGNDSGPGHLSASYGLPTITLFGPTFAGRTGPYPVNQKKNVAIQAIIPCGPCHMTDRMEKCKKPICHDDISIKDITLAWNALVKRGVLYGQSME